MTLGQKQRKFTKMVARLILKAYSMGYELSFAQAYRTARQARAYAAQGVGILNSLHTKRLAIDLNLFKDGKYLTSTKAHLPLGLWWEKQGGTWGGRFRDGNHYSLEHNGVK